MRTIPVTPKRTHHGFHDDEGACHERAVEPGRADPGRLDWFTSAVLPDGGQRVRICRCARGTPTEAVELDCGASALQRNPADLRGLAELDELALVDPAVSWTRRNAQRLRPRRARRCCALSGEH